MSPVRGDTYTFIWTWSNYLRTAHPGGLYFPFSQSLVRCMRPICESVAFTCSAQLLACRGDDPQSPNQIHSLVKEQCLSGCPWTSIKELPPSNGIDNYTIHHAPSKGNSQQKWSSRKESNLRPPLCQSGTLNQLSYAKFGRPPGTRTQNLLHVKELP